MSNNQIVTLLRRSPPVVPWTKRHQLIGVTLQVRALKDGPIDSKIAIALHGWFLKQVAQTDPALSRHLHDDQKEKAFTLSGLYFRGEYQLARRLEANQLYEVRISSLNKPTCNWLKDWVEQLPEWLCLRGGDRFQIEGWKIHHPPTTYRQLLLTQQNLAQPTQSAGRSHTSEAFSLPTRIQLSFVSPTSFRSRGRHLPLPLSKNIFHSYLRRWNVFAKQKIADEPFLDWVEKAIQIRSYQLQTQRLTVAKGGEQVTGFLGNLELEISVRGDRDRLHLVHAHTLCHLAPYCGTGHKTPFCLGQTGLGAIPMKHSVSAEIALALGEPSSPEQQQLIQQYAQTALRIEELRQIFLENRQQRGGERAIRKAAAMAAIMARREAGESLQKIAQELQLNYETAKSYSKWAKKELATGKVRQK